MSVIFWTIFIFVFVIVVALLLKGCQDGCTGGGTSEGIVEQEALERRAREAGFRDGVNGGHANMASVYIIDQAPPAYTVVTAETNYPDMELVAPPAILVRGIFVSMVEFAEPGHTNGGFDEEPPPPYPGLPR